MPLVVQLVSTAHLHILKFLACFSQTRGCGIVFDPSILQIIQPFLKRGRSYIIELVHTNQIILREHLFGRFHFNNIILFDINLKRVTSMHSYKGVLAMIKVV